MIRELKARLGDAELAANSYRLPPVPPEYLLWDSRTDRILRITDRALRVEAERIAKAVFYEEAKAGRIERPPDVLGSSCPGSGRGIEEELRICLERAAREHKMLEEARDLLTNRVGSEKKAIIQFFLLKQSVETNRSVYEDFLRSALKTGIDIWDPESGKPIVLLESW